MNTESFPPSENINEPTTAATPAAKKRGRPSSRTPELEAALFECLQLGMNVDEACGHCGVSEKSYRNWRKSSRVFSEMMKRAEMEAVKMHLDVIRRAATKAQSWRASVWWLEHRHPMKWGKTGAMPVRERRQAQNDISGTRMTDAQRRARIRQVMGLPDEPVTRPESKVTKEDVPPAPDMEAAANRVPEPESPFIQPHDEPQPAPAPVDKTRIPSVFIGGARNGEAAVFSEPDGSTHYQDGYELMWVTFDCLEKTCRLRVFARNDLNVHLLKSEASRLLLGGNQPVTRAVEAQGRLYFLKPDGVTPPVFPGK